MTLLTVRMNSFDCIIIADVFHTSQHPSKMLAGTEEE